jgi:hypothetical protein
MTAPVVAHTTRNAVTAAPGESVSVAGVMADDAGLVPVSDDQVAKLLTETVRRPHVAEGEGKRPVAR